jgi:hypothetical protein
MMTGVGRAVFLDHTWGAGRRSESGTRTRRAVAPKNAIVAVIFVSPSIFPIFTQQGAKLGEW